MARREPDQGYVVPSGRERLAGVTVVLLLSGAGGAVAAEDGSAQYWQRSCARCHTSVADVMPYPAGMTEAQREDLDRFLAGHRAPDAAIRAALIQWMIGQTSE